MERALPIRRWIAGVSLFFHPIIRRSVWIAAEYICSRCGRGPVQALLVEQTRQKYWSSAGHVQRRRRKRKKDVGGHLWCLRSTASCGAGMPWMRWPVNTEMRPRDNPLLLLLEGCVFSRAELRPACSPAAVDVITFPLYGPSTVRWRTTASSRLMAVSWRPPPWGPRALP